MFSLGRSSSLEGEMERLEAEERGGWGRSKVVQSARLPLGRNRYARK